MAADFGLDCSDLDAALDATMRRAIYPASHALRKKGFASSFNTTRDPASNERCSVQLSSDIRASAIIVYSKQECNHSDSSEEIFDLDSEVDKSCKTFAYDDCFQVERSSPRDVHSVRALYNFRTGLMVSSELALEEKATSSVPWTNYTLNKFDGKQWRIMLGYSMIAEHSDWPSATSHIHLIDQSKAAVDWNGSFTSAVDADEINVYCRS
jgi:hypothetical protein